ncbi:MAG: hypothetical protein EPN46_02465 [Candidimonas sp.]|nr:MAG: hypothetical protein EPN77_05345 [Candidimonas sp.]TAM22308.1 MAG: hypothetical protein EPN62_12315 [Candidimonas sp.]TAM80196.1 MAG: hypothetical protein EPN46_02465 [Candidimonas sp.]
MSDTLQEFVTTLKYKAVNEREFIDGVDTTGRKIVQLGKLAATAGLAIGAMAAKYAESMEQVEFVAKRVGSSVTHIKALEKAGASLGSSAQGARSSLEGLAKFMRDTPASGGFLKALGVQSKDAKGHALDTVQVMKNLATVFQKMPVYRANQYAQVLGISDNMMLAMRDKSFNAKLDEYNAVVERGEINEAAKSSHTAMNKGRILDLKAQNVAAEAATPVLDKFNDLDDATQGLSTEFLAAAEVIGGTTIALKLLTSAAGTAAKALAGGGAAGGSEAAAAGGAAAGGFLSRWLSKLLGPYAVGGYLATYSKSLNKGEDAQLDAIHAKPAKNVDQQLETVKYYEKLGWTKAQSVGIVANLQAESHMDPKAVGDHGAAYGIGQWHKDRQDQFKRLYGFDIHQSTLDQQLAFVQWELNNSHKAAGDALRKTTTPQAAAAAVSRKYEIPAHANLQARERGNAAGALYGQADLKSRDANGNQKYKGKINPLNTEIYADRMAALKTASVNASSRLNANQSILPLNQNNPNNKRVIPVTPQVTQNQTTTINVNGSNDPLATANAVANAQKRVNELSARNTAGAVR